ncbi:hypothetical protein B9Z65_5755 [Elsinoe australis]|uniref:Uncharacterized protein n=1 Tax=Elsinoe australis TaxID=40998 RepID=A0A2P7YJ05_9PEZI|nr:hypothetical protein B9Z65_5755 [Elsinoe australis]
MADHEDAKIASDTVFDASWSDGDNAAFLPNNIPLKRVARAWERKPHSPHGARPGVRKVWRRVRMPVFNASASYAETDLGRSLGASVPDHHVTIESPKKAVKKLCLKTPYGQDWRTTEWDPRGVHMRKQAIRPPIVLRSGARIDPNIDDDVNPEQNDDEEQESELESTADENPENEWEDVESEAEAETEDYEEYIEEHEDLTSEVGSDEALADENETQDANQDTQGIVNREQAVSGTNETEPGKRDQKARSREPSQSDTISIEQIDSPLSDVETISPVKKSTATRPSERSPAKQLLDIPALSVPSPLNRPTSAPPKETSSNENKYRPRISDDTAILHAFLSRAAASKKPIAKRESLTNRRDSGMVRQALSSPAKPEVLAELDTNSPSPHKAARLEPGEQLEAASIEKPAPMEKSASPLKKEEPAEDNKPKRRSGRSRARPALLLDQITTEAPTKGPNKITIRGPTEQVSLKKNEVQELATQTRSNTRKNKGQSVMPLVRLNALADEALSQADDKQETATSEPSRGGKNVKWDETLTYFSKSPDEPAEVEPEALQAADISPALPIEDPPLSPTKARSKRNKAASPKNVAAEPSPAPEEPSATETPASRPAHSKRRSRIATPAKGLLGKSSLLPEDVTAPTPSETEPTKPAPSSQPPTTGPAKKARSLPTPKRSAVNVINALKQCKDDASAPAPKQPTLLQRPPIQSPRKPQPAPAPASNANASAIPSLTTFAPKMSNEIPKLSFEDAVAAQGSGKKGRGVGIAAGNGEEEGGERLGLASPAKRRRGVVGRNAGAVAAARGQVKEGRREEEREVPGLGSPAKKRTRSAV